MEKKISCRPPLAAVILAADAEIRDQLSQQNPAGVNEELAGRVAAKTAAELGWTLNCLFFFLAFFCGELTDFRAAALRAGAVE